MDAEDLKRITEAAKKVESEGIAAYHVVSRLVGEEIAGALLVAHLRRTLRSMSTYPADPEIDPTVVGILRKEGILLD